MERQDATSDDIIDLGPASEMTQGMMGDDLEGFERQPHAGLSDL